MANLAVPCLDRENSKGTQVFWRFYSYTGTPQAWARLGGITGFEAPKFARAAVVDTTELDPQPTTLPDVNTYDESYFYTGQCPGTKKLEPQVYEMNMIPAQFLLLLEKYNNDVRTDIAVIFRSGRKFIIPSYVEAIGVSVQENQKVKAPVTFNPIYSYTTLAAGEALP